MAKTEAAPSPDRATIGPTPGPTETLAQVLGPALLEAGHTDPSGLARAMRAAEEAGERFDRVLVRLGIVGERDLATALARVLDRPLARPADYPELPVFVDALPGRFLRHAQILPLGGEDTDEGASPDAADARPPVPLAMADPLDEGAIRAVALRLERPVRPIVAVPTDLENALERLYSNGKSSIDAIAETLDDADGDSSDADIARLRDLANDAPVIRIVNVIIRKAVEAGASDIHIEPFDNRLRVRLRVDGVLQEIESPPARLQAAVLSRIKIMARLNIAEHRLPQDGRIKAVIGGKEIDLRVATSPTIHGEGVVLRILDKQAQVLDFTALGFQGPDLERFRALLHRPNGIVLVTGPTGSGKTTTLYTALKELNTRERKVITVEDPVEYQLEGINQIQARPKIGLTFAHALRSILRQDPDVIMIGEIRDLETAGIAVQAALTGHLVLATLHTNTAAATVSRLLDMGVEDYLLASTLNAIVSQRLVRRLCPSCRAPGPVMADLVAHLGADGAAGETFFHPRGCARCAGRGYQGRTALVELLEVGDPIRRLILNRADAGTLQDAALAQGMTLMREAGIARARAGETSLEEVIRATNAV
ncbi:MAG: GspE/PulE family protein [Alphaproteobacteria bacterium]